MKKVKVLEDENFDRDDAIFDALSHRHGKHPTP
jgi:hypothetical protein